MSDRQKTEQPVSRGAPLAAVIVGAIAIAWAGYWAWAAQQNRTLPLDLDGWGHLVTRLKENGGAFGSLFVQPSLWKGPLVPFVYGLTYYLAPFDESVLVLNVILYGLAAGVLVDAFCRLRVGRIGASLAVLCWVFYLPHQIVFGYYYAEPFVSFLLALIIWLCAIITRRPTLTRMLTLGVFCGVLLLARAPFLFAVAGLPLVLWPWLGVRRPFKLACVPLGVALLIGPWAVRNYLVEGELVPFTTEAGKTLFEGTYLPGDDVPMNELRQLPEFQQLEANEGESAVQQYRYWKALAIAQVREDPLGQLRLLVRKAMRFWVYLPPHSWVPTWKTAAVAALALPLAALGAWRGRRWLLVRLCVLFVGTLWITHAIVHSELRYNFPVLPLLMMLAVLGLRSLWGGLPVHEEPINQAKEAVEGLQPAPLPVTEESGG